jgi:hypothetical protein
MHYDALVFTYQRGNTMKKTLHVLTGAAILGASLLLALPVSANHHAAPQAPIPPMPMAGAGPIAMDPNCVAQHDMAILKCGQKAKCKAKHEKLKMKCPRVAPTAGQSAILPYYPVPGQPGMMPPPMMKGGMMRGPGMMSAPKVLEGMTPQSTGNATGIKTLPENLVKPFWE